MRVKRITALILALLFAAVIVPVTGSAADMEYDVNYGEYFSIYLWEGYDYLDDVVVESGALPPGIHVIKEYNSSSGTYEFFAAGAPTATGTYFATMEICPNGLMHSYFTLQITVIYPIKIKTKTLPQATEGVYYQGLIETNYSYNDVDFVEIWNPGVGVVLPYLGLTLAENGTVYGTPKRSGTYYIYVGVSCKLNSSYDEAMVKLVIKENEDPDPTDPPAAVVPGCFFDADSIIYYEPGGSIDELLFEFLDDGSEIGEILGGIPEYLELVFVEENHTVRLTGEFPKKIEGDGVIEIDVPIVTGENFVFVHYMLRPSADLSAYPSANDMPAGF